ncbi:(2Fe-2S) ferredoxin domain-containing protein [Domibacillus mangrovi]|uniref:Cobalamin biosynthesis protein n=1 Tax=Domibacillus mangrovi TaxID=1714354 RepID=A0A1Q5NZ05_9BACI|nr:(2Fe-2S) ferredoxin domain-containing protein [Domibacillus mangrovi]OKL35237.1 cobalamin biosynthesis protein [Domibacillus mangrovi]
MTTWNLEGTKSHLLICNGSSCMRKGGEEVTQAVRDEISLLELDEEIHTTRTRCNGRCKDACIVIAYPEGAWYRVESPEMGRQIVRNMHEPLLKTNKVYQFVNGEMSLNLDASAAVGISKKK